MESNAITQRSTKVCRYGEIELVVGHTQTADLTFPPLHVERPCFKVLSPPCSIPHTPCLRLIRRSTHVDLSMPAPEPASHPSAHAPYGWSLSSQKSDHFSLSPPHRAHAILFLSCPVHLHLHPHDRLLPIPSYSYPALSYPFHTTHRLQLHAPSHFFSSRPDPVLLLLLPLPLLPSLWRDVQTN